MTDMADDNGGVFFGKLVKNAVCAVLDEDV